MKINSYINIKNINNWYIPKINWLNKKKYLINTKKDNYNHVYAQNNIFQSNIFQINKKM